MTVNLLVTAASKHGATAELADAIADELRAAGLEATRLDPSRVTELDPYDAVVLGSAIYTGRWLEEARAFAQRQHGALLARPIWLFSSGPIGEPLAPTEEAKDGPRLAAELGARDHRTFPGRINPETLSWVERTITRMVRAPDGDFRDWEAVRAWARDIADALRSAPAPDEPEVLTTA